jgi:hypothetical protein
LAVCHNHRLLLQGDKLRVYLLTWLYYYNQGMEKIFLKDGMEGGQKI